MSDSAGSPLASNDLITGSAESGSLTVTANRRQILLRLSAVATAVTLPVSASAAAAVMTSLGASDLAMLAGVAYDILPYAELPPTLYARAARRILDADDPAVAPGVALLRHATHDHAWRDLPQPQRVATLESLQTSPFFHVMRTLTLQVLLRDPLTYAVVGYGGPSIPYGGYLIRGFDDIGWLPKPGDASHGMRP